MRKLILLLSIIITLGCYAETNQEKKFRKLAEKIELPRAVRTMSASESGDFWELLVDNDWQLKQFDSKITKNKGADKEAKEKYASLPRFYPLYNSYVDTALQPYADSLFATVGSPASNPAEGLYIMADYIPAAYTVLTYSAYAVCLTTGLLAKPGVTDELLRAIVARQVAHGALRHQLRYFYDQAVDKRRRRTIGGLALGLSLAAVTALELTDPDPTYDYYGNLYIRNNITVEGNKPYRLPAAIYSPDQVYEADLVGYRFMQAEGKGDLYIDALHLLAPEITDGTATDTGEPVMSERIDFIRFISDNPNILNTKSEQLRRKSRPKP